jgi:hypothetical protein
MEARAKQSNETPRTSGSQERFSKTSGGETKRDKATSQIMALAAAFRETLTSPSLAIYLESLSDLSDNQLALAVGRAIRELKFFPRVAELRELAGVLSAEQQRDAEMRAAWDILTKYVGKYVGNSVEGNYGPQYGSYGPSQWPARYPELPQRILDCIRRSGGWAVYKNMGEDDVPHQQRRFFEEYRAWTAVETNLQQLAAQMPELRQLAALKRIDAPPKQAEKVS